MSRIFSNLAISVSLSVSATSALAFVKTGPQITVNAKIELKNAAKNFQLSNRELAIKTELQNLKKNDRRKFEAELQDSLANGVDFQSYLYEVRDGRTNIEKAKQLAKHYLYLAARKNWQDLRNTIVNQYSSNSWREFDPYIKGLIDQRLLYSPEKTAEKAAAGSQTSKEYQFKIDDWGSVKVTERAGKITALSWLLTAKSPHADNQMPPGWETIRIAE